MARIRKYGSLALLILVVLIGVQVGASFVVKTRRMRTFLTARLENAFGRPVRAGDFSIQLLPMPQLEIDRVTIGEDPAFGQEYFLRADRMTARLRWSGLLLGRFQFGTMSLTRPSLILVRNSEGRWNLERWLPPAARAGLPASGSATPVSAQKPAESTHHLQTLEFEDGRINFKVGNEKRPFAFISVSGSVEQISSGRWRLRLEAQPWRSGVQLQSTGTLYVAGDVAGTSARLQPAQIQVHWEKVSVADMFRLVTGNDSGVRGEFALDGNASVGTEPPASNTGVSEWCFDMQARATQLHRWDFTERSDNPRVNLNVKGVWDRATEEARAEELRVELPRSNLSGAAVLHTGTPTDWQAQFQDMTIQAEDLLAWYRAFQPGMADDVAVKDSLTGNLALSGWPLHWDDGRIESTGGTLAVPELRESRIDPFHATVRAGKFSVEGLRVRLGAPTASAQNAKARVAPGLEDSIEFNLNHDSLSRQGNLRLNLRLTDAARFFKLSSALGRHLDQGWEYNGGANGFFAWNWAGSVKDTHRSGSVELLRSRLAIVGLNQPLKIDESRLEWRDGRRTATISKAEGFGANWSGTISEVGEVSAATENNWHFQLHADRLDAAELDRWFGPRARPNWLQRLLTPLLGQSEATVKASELLRRVSAEGDLTADLLSIEKFKLQKAHATLAFHNLQLQVSNAEAQWAGGNVQGYCTAVFSPVPHYEVTAEIDRANLAQLPWPPKWAERWGGTASGTLQLSTGGVGREELLKQLIGQGDVKLSKIELRGWDVRASMDSGVARAGTSRWSSGEGKFEIGDQEVRFEAIQLDGPQARTQLTGTLGFDMSGQVTFLPGADARRGTRIVEASRVLSLSGPLDTPKAVVQPVSEETVQP
jgi:AsmA family/AsmA-like C-terminal region